MDRVALLPSGTGFAELTGGVVNDWQTGLNAYVRGELGFRAGDRVGVFGFAQADMKAAQAGVGARVTF